MKTLLLILLIAISFHPRLPAQLSETGTTFSVMTYNIRYAGGEKEGDINNWSKRKYLVAKVITKYKPDIIGLQEAEKIQIDDLMNLSDGYNWIGVGRNDGKEAGEFTAIFYNKNRFELIRNLTFWLSETPGVPSRGWDAALNRTVTVAELLDKKSGKSLYLFNTHFDHVGEKARIESVKLLVEKINEIAGDKPVIVTCDLNSTPNSSAYNLLTSSYEQETKHHTLYDAQTISEQPPTGGIVTYNGFGKTMNMGRRIDFVFVDDRVKVISYQIVKDTFNGLYPSDHWAVLAYLCLR